jgi:hypothetical protein
MYGYGYSRPWQDAYEPPTLTCGRQDFEAALKEYEFLDNPDLETDVSVLVYYSTELNHNIKTKLYCIVSGNARGNLNWSYVCSIPDQTNKCLKHKSESIIKNEYTFDRYLAKQVEV